MQLQSHLGRVEKNPRIDERMFGYLCLGRIVKVHHKQYAVDIQLVRTKDTFSSNPAYQGRHACRVITANIGYDSKTCESWGTVEPLEVNQLVLVGFIEGMRQYPIVLGSIHRPSPNENILTEEYPISNNNIEEALKYLKVFPNQNYIKVKQNGDLEVTLGGNSYLLFKDSLNDNFGGVSIDNLTEKSKVTHKTRQSPVIKDILLNLASLDSMSTKFFISKNGTSRITRYDSPTTKTQVCLSSDGNFSIIRNTGGGSSIAVVKNNGQIVLQDATGSTITLTNDSCIHIDCSHLYMNYDLLSLDGDIDVIGHITATKYISAGEDLQSVTGVHTEGDVSAVKSITTQDSVQANKTINAVGNITTQSNIIAEKDITAKGDIYGKNDLWIDKDIHADRVLDVSQNTPHHTHI